MATVEAAPPRRPVTPRFSNHFEINKRQSELQFIDILLQTDVKLYIDPYALSTEEDAWSIECNNLVISFFQELVDALRAKNLLRAQDLLNNLHEPNETRLGESRHAPRGRGVGHDKAMGLYHAFAKSKAVETGILTDLSECELFVEGISNDTISDITTNIIRLKLIEFTKQECQRWGVPMQSRPTGVWWDLEHKRWRSTYDQLPVYRGESLILVPKRAVRYWMAIDDRRFYDFDVVDFIRNEFNRAECLNPSSSLFKALRMGLRVTKKDVKEEFPKSKDFLRQFAEQFPDVLKKFKKIAKEQARAGAGKPSDSGIYILEKDIAHRQGCILIEELNVTVTTNNTSIGRDNLGAIGQGQKVVIKDVKVYKAGVDSAQGIADETKELLKQAFDLIDVALIDDQDKDDAKGDLQKLTAEMEGKKEPGRIQRYLTGIAQVVKPAAELIKSGGEIAHLLNQMAGLGG
jgi:hypothetical protein